MTGHHNHYVAFKKVVCEYFVNSLYISFSLLIFGYVYKQSSSLSWKWAKAENIGWVLTTSKPMKI